MPRADAPPLTFTLKMNFGVGQVAEGIKTCAFNSLLFFYYSAVLGLSGSLTGTALFIALLFDALTDPVAGSVSDRWRGPRGRRHPFMYASALPLGLAFIALFVPPAVVQGSGDGLLFAWMLTFTVLTRASMTLYHVPHMAIGAELSTDYDERTVLTAFRHFFGATGFIVVYALAFGVFFAATEAYPNGQINPAAYPPLALWLAGIMVVTILWSAAGTHSRIPYLPQAPEQSQRVRLSEVLFEALGAMRNESFRWMMFGFILIILVFGVLGASQLHMFTFFWQLDRLQILFVLVMAPVGSMFGYLVAKPIFAWLDKRNAMIFGGLVFMVAHAVPVSLYLIGWTPVLGSWWLAVFLACVGIFAGGAIGQIVVGIGTAMADIADENELTTGRRQEGVFFGASAFANKSAAALGALSSGVILDGVGWPTDESIRTAADVPSEVILNFGLLVGPTMSVLVIPGILCLLGYKLNRARLTDIQMSLRQRHAAAVDAV